MIQKIIRITREVTALTVIASLFVAVLIPALEPQLANAVEDQFTVTQSVTGEVSFLTPATDVTLSSIPGLTGGTSFGGTQVIVTTNDTSGYTMTIKSSSSPAMQGNTQGGTIANYTPANASVPDYAFSVPSGAEFAYSVSASTTADLAQKFLDNGSTTCNTGSADTSGSASCWYAMSTVATTTNVRTSQTTASGATTTIFFQLKINAGSVVEDLYTATTTLTATTN